MNTPFSYDQFQRQIMLHDFGLEAQQKISNAKVLVIGCGGLGCPAIQYLISMGVKHLGIVDSDIVSSSNLHRQILFSFHDIGKKKVDVIYEKYHQQLEVKKYDTVFNQLNAIDIIQAYDIVLDCTDNFKSRYIINDACVMLNKPFIFGAVFQYEGQVSVFNVGKNGINYRDVFPVSPSVSESPSCAESGVYAIATGLIGIMQAGEVIKIITGIGEVLTNKLVTIDTRSMNMYTIELLKNENAHTNIPNTKDEFEHYSYNEFCGLNLHISDEITAEEFELLRSRNDVQLVDIRNEDELPDVSELNALRIPLLALKHEANLLDTNKRIILFCHSGMRTQTALEILQDELHFNNVSHLKGGIIKWLDYKSRL